ncbi:MAG: hypothetical protein KJO65_08805, partial [Gemmatimonadetes bacterium]|nr:hypothetical protein [Gemmatimonadota bacterium]
MTMMMWMVWSALVAGLFAVSAWLAESALRERGWPTRWPWLVALLASVAGLMVAWLRPVGIPGVESINTAEGWMLVDPAWFAELSTAAVSARPVSERVEDVLVVGWIVFSLAGIAALVG